MPEPRQTLTRDRILDAAQRILVRDGGDRLTIASVAEEARISKGGLFYHFASKQDLVEGLIERYTREIASSRRRTTLPARPSRPTSGRRAGPTARRPEG